MEFPLPPHLTHAIQTHYGHIDHNIEIAMMVDYNNINKLKLFSYLPVLFFSNPSSVS